MAVYRPDLIPSPSGSVGSIDFVGHPGPRVNACHDKALGDFRPNSRVAERRRGTTLNLLVEGSIPSGLTSKIRSKLNTAFAAHARGTHLI